MIYIDGNQGKVQIMEAPLEAVDSHVLAEQLHEMFAANEREKQHVSVVSAGRGAEHAWIGCLNFSYWDKRRKLPRLKQAGRGGIGTVFRNKKIKALVVKYSGLTGKSNNPVDMETLQKTGLKLHKEIITLDDKQCQMRTIGTAHLVEIMNDYDLLPTKNFRFGSHPEAEKLASWVWKAMFTQNVPDGCWFGCTMSCAHGVDNFELRTGPYKGHKVLVDGPEYETVGGCGSNPAIFDPDAVIEINFYCDTYGLDTISFGTLTGFIMDCYENGILNKERTGGLEMTWGNWEAALETDAPDRPRRGLRPDRRQGRQVHAGILRQGIRRRRPVPQGHRHARQGAGAVGIHVQGVAGPAGRLLPDQQGAAARRGLADLHGHGQQPDPHLREQGRGPALLPDVPHLVRPAGSVQAALERRRAGRQRQARRAQQGARARAELRRHLQRHHRRDDRPRKS